MSSAAVRRTLQQELAGLGSRPPAGDGRAPAADPLGAGRPAALAYACPALYFGRVVDGVPYARTYKVQLDGLNAAVPCRDLAHASFVPYGPRQLATYAPGTAVVVAYHARLGEGVIVGAVPDAAVDPRHGTGDAIVQGGRTGVKVDLANAYPFWMAQGGGVSDFSAGRPTDSTGGEWGMMTETGLAFFLDPFQAYVRVDEGTGLFLFYHDQLTRLAGYNFQLRTAAGDREDADDRGEVTSEAGWAAYVWEGQGRRTPDASPAVEQTAAQVQNETPYLSRFEPAVADQRPYHRLTEFRGYLGQAEARFLTLPSAVSAMWPNRLSSPGAHVGVFAEHLALSGRYTVRSAKGVTVAKAAAVGAPRRRAEAAAPTGDGAANYNPAGTAAGGVAHAIVDRTAPPVADGTAAVAATAALFDQLAYQFNWEAAHPFFYHELDWYLPEVAEGPLPRAELPVFARLADYQYLEAPTATTLPVDHRHDATYYAVESLLHLADDGSVVLADGFGAEIRMSQGSIFISAPGDVWVQPGKNLNAWCGHDFIAKARNSVDLTGTAGDVRVKAQKNVMIAGGFDGCGGVLVESRATATSYDVTAVGEQARLTGVVLISRAAPVVAAGAHVLVTTNWRRYGGVEMFGPDVPVLDPENGSGEFVGAGGIAIDAGPHEVSVYGAVIHRHIGVAAVDVFAPPYAEASLPYVVNEFSHARAAIGTPLDVSGRLLAATTAVVGGDLLVAGDAANATGAFKRLVDADRIAAAVLQAETRADDMDGYAREARHAGRALLEDGAVRRIEFTFRTPAEYKTEGLILYESRWQQQARLTGESLVMFGWPETEVRETMPHPGRSPWLGDSFRQQDGTLYDSDEEGYVDRGTPGDSPYEAPQSPAPVAVPLHENYLLLFPTP